MSNVTSNVVDDVKEKQVNETGKEVEETSAPVKEPVKEDKAVANVTTNLTFNEFSWLDVGTATKLYSLAKALSSSKVVPDNFRGDPASCMIVMELADRLKMPLMAVFQNVYVVNGKPSWSGKYCIMAIEASGKFDSPEYVWYYNKDGNVNGCSVQAVRKSNGKLCVGAKIDWDTVKGFGWEKKSGSMWNIPGQREQMFMYRAAEYFVNAFCPEMFAGMYSEYSQRDVSGYEERPETVTIKVEEG